MASSASCFVLAFLMFCRSILTTSVHTNASDLKQRIIDEFVVRSSIDRVTRPGLYHHHEDCSIEVITSQGHVHNTLTEDGHLGNITLHFTAFGKRFHVSLKLTRDLFGDTYIRKIVHERGEDFREPIHSKEHCYYQGKVHKKPSSLAAVSTCDGVRGFVSDGQETYYIEPVSGSIHRIYRHSDIKAPSFLCGTGEGPGHRPVPFYRKRTRRRRSLRRPYDADKLTRFVELYLVNDYRTYDRYGKAASVVFKRSQDIANIVNSLYRQLNMYVVLVGVEVWSTGDKISITSNADTTMENFLRYRMERINPYHPNDNAQLITGISFDHGVVGKAIKGPICTHQFSGGVSMDHNGPVTLVATTVAHEMGHNFGMEHDNDTKCSCPQDKCIMAATSGHLSPRHWSSCSENSLQEAFELGMDYCLRDLPAATFDGPVCGNGLVEEGEECDCGLIEDCTNRCCNATSCRLHPKAVCAAGQCCDLTTCRVKAATTPCRESQNECDLPEFCDGSSEFCPGNVYKQDGKPCKSHQSYCYKGQCHTHTAQCQLLWGDTGRVSDPLCFQHLNVRGTRDGNCGYNWTTERYQTCERENVMCGLLHCVHLNEKLMFWRDNLALAMQANFLSRGNQQYVCRSTILDVGLDMPDPGMVPDGAKCEEDKICIKQTCTPLMKLKIPQCPDCSGNGVCNNLGNCHCDDGYKPPYCDIPGYGGSINSGPSSNEYGNRGLLIGMLVLFLVILPLLVLAVIIYMNRQRLMAWLKQEPRGRFSVLRRPAWPSQPPRPQPSNGVTQKRWSSAPSRASARLEITGPLLDDPSVSGGAASGGSSPNPPPRPKAPPRPVFKPSPSRPPGVSSTIQHLGPPPVYPEGAGKDGRSTTGSGTVVSSQSKMPGTSSVSTSGASQPPQFLALNNPTPTTKAWQGDKEKQKAAGRPSLSPPTSPGRGGKQIGHSQSMREPRGNEDSGEKLVKRQSFRGADISSPVLVSTTNRDSQVFASFEVDKTGVIARPVQQHHSFHGSHPAPDSARPGVHSPVRRTQSDRPLSPTRPGNASSGGPETIHGFKGRPLPPEPVLEDEPVYMNEEFSDLGDLEAEISSAFDGLYRNIPAENKSAASGMPPHASSNAAEPVSAVDSTNSSLISAQLKRFGPPRPAKGPSASSSTPSQNPSSRPVPTSQGPRNPVGTGGAKNPQSSSAPGVASKTAGRGRLAGEESKMSSGSAQQAVRAGAPRSAGRGTSSQAQMNVRGPDTGRGPSGPAVSPTAKPLANSNVSASGETGSRPGSHPAKVSVASAARNNPPAASKSSGSKLLDVSSSEVKHPGQGGQSRADAQKARPGPTRPSVAPKPTSGKPVRSYKF